MKDRRKYWPVPDSYGRRVPTPGAPGSFWEPRGDRFHAGVDIYAPAGSQVLAIEPGRVVQVGLFTSPQEIPYWHETFFLLVAAEGGRVCKYAELGRVLVREGQRVEAGQELGRVGIVLNPERIGEDAPHYIRRLKADVRLSMLHFELYDGLPAPYANYLGGNFFQDQPPEELLDPTPYLKETEVNK